MSRKLRQHLRTDALLGVESVPRGAGVLGGEDAKPQAVSGAERVVEARAVSPTVRSEDIPGVAPGGTPGVDRAGKLQLLGAMDRDEVKGCVKCALCQTRTNTVFGEGNADARIMFIGEGPGENEDLQGRPFVGRAGDLLNKQIGAMGLKREDVFIANIVKCRPPNNRPPAPDEVAACFDYLVRQIDIIRPEVIVTLGGPAMKAIINTRDGITKVRGTWFEFTGLVPRGGPVIPVMPTFHPAYLLRSYTVENRAKVWSDLKAVMAKLGITAAK